MFPGYVTIYKDVDNYIHLYFFAGIKDNNKPFYKDLDLLNSKLKHEKIIHEDGAIEYIFEKKNIIKFNCTLVEHESNKQHKIILTL